MAVGDAFLSAFLQVAFDRLASRDLIDLAHRLNVDHELKKLERTLLKIQAVLNDAEEKQIRNHAVKMWLDDIKHLAYDAEDVLDEFATEALRLKLESESQSNPNQVWSFNIPTSFNPSVVSFKLGIGSKIKDITAKLEDIAKERFELGLREDVGGARSIGIKQRRMTSSSVVESDVWGREKDREKIIELLLLDDEASGNEVCVIPIVGMGGVGKTTLAQLVYNDKEVDKHFNLKAWACVSEEFDVLRVTKAILESATRNNYDLKELDALQGSLKNTLSGKKFLLVLDDVWNENYNDWDVLRIPFRVGAQGSKIIVTTRNEEVSLIMGTVPTHQLGLLSNEECWSLFLQHAFANKHFDALPDLELIGKKIVEKCKGLPLAAKTLGGLLRSKIDVDEWEDILNNEIWELTEEESEILPALRLSYHHLPAHLKRCFAYCSIFPKDYEFEKEKLVLLWMAEGFVQPKRKKGMEDVGAVYFDDLLQRSLFQKSHDDEYRFVMHDLINDLARFVSGDLCFRLEGNNSCKVFEKARHSSYLSEKYDVITKFEAFYDVECLRTFLPLGLRRGWTDYCYLPNQVPHDLLSRLRCLRVLCLSWYLITVLPDSIGNLKHLRYLDLSSTRIKRLPESVSTLYNLQTLLLRGCIYLAEMPNDMGNLINLRHLELNQCLCLQKMSLGIGRLTSLQTLTEFVVGKNSGSGIRELRDISHLRGRLCISNLENVVNVRDAMEAKLKNKKQLYGLGLRWSYRGNNVDTGHGNQEDVLDWLQPHMDLKELTITSFGGTRFPSWIGDPSFSNLVIVRLSNCRKCTFLPSLGQLPSLKDLNVYQMDGIKSVGREFCGDGVVKQFGSLETLCFQNMPEWEEWSGVEEFPSLRELFILICPKLRKVPHGFSALVKFEVRSCEELTALPKLPNLNSEEGKEFPCLRELTIWNCPNLRELPTLLPSLAQLEMYECQGLTALPRVPLLRTLDLKECDEMVLKSVVDHPASFISLMHISQISNLTCLPEWFMQHLTALEELEITGCSELMDLSDEFGLHKLTSLRRLVISRCPQLVSLQEVVEGMPTRLEYLEIRNCFNLKKLPHKLHNLTSLGTLIINRSQGLVPFAEMGLPLMLKHLKIRNCKNLESLHEGMFNNTSLEFLEIYRCSLTSFPQGGLPTSLKHLQIRYCMNLESLPEEMHNTSLEYLGIEGCGSLTSFPRSLGLPSTTVKLKEIIIWDCMNLESLPEGLHDFTYLKNLEVVRCPRLVSFMEGGFPTANLRSVLISDCENLKSLPVRIHNLTSIQELKIESCPSLVSFPEGGLPTNLKSLCIVDCKNLEPLTKWGLHRLSSLQDFTIDGCPSPISFPEWLLPNTLTSVSIKRLLNLESLSKGLHNLTSLERLEIIECHKLASLPAEDLPAMLGHLEIRQCHLLKQWCEKDKGENWIKIARIPCIKIDGMEII